MTMRMTARKVAERQDAMALLLRQVAALREDIAGLRREVMDVRGQLPVKAAQTQVPNQGPDLEWLKQLQKMHEDAQKQLTPHPPWTGPVGPSPFNPGGLPGYPCPRPPFWNGNW